MRYTRSRDSLSNATRVQIILDGPTKARLRDLSESTKTSQSAIVDWLIRTVKTDEHGRVPALVSEQEELPT